MNKETNILVDDNKLKPYIKLDYEINSESTVSIKKLYQNYEDPILLSTTETIFDQLSIANICQNYDHVGHNLVAFCANEIIAKGANPLFLREHLSFNSQDIPVVKIINSIAAACQDVGCSMIGGGKAVFNSSREQVDLLGFMVGVAERKNLFSHMKVKEGDIILGIKANGLGFSGYSKAKQIIFEHLGHRSNDILWQTPKRVCTVEDELMAYSKIYVNDIKSLVASGVKINTVSHVTDGGLLSAITKLLPAHLMAEVEISKALLPQFFSYLMDKSRLNEEIMVSEFGMGVGLVMTVPKHYLEQVCNNDHMLILGRVVGALKEEGRVSVSWK